MKKIIGIGIFFILLAVGLNGCTNQDDKEDNNPYEHEHEMAQFGVEGTVDGYLKVTLIGEGDNYGSGYTDYDISVNDENVLNLPETVRIGESFDIGEYNLEYMVDGDSLSYGEYRVKITVFKTIVYDDDVTIEIPDY